MDFFAQVPTNIADDAADWWQSTREWMSESSTLISVSVIVIGAIIVWLIGRLAIRGIIHGITEGLEWGEQQAKDVLVKVKLSGHEEESITDQLADQRRLTRASTIGMVLRAALNVVVLAITVLMILAEVGVSVTPILASAGVVGVALGFGAQSLVKDILTGIFMLLEDQFGVGDIVDLGQAVGAVEEIGLRTTRLRGLDGTLWFVPNGEVLRVGNMTQLWSRALIEVRFGLDTDIEAARQAMLDAAQMAAKDPDVKEALVGEPEVAGVEAMDFNGVMLRLMIQVRPVTQWSVMRAIRQHMIQIFKERGIDMAAPADHVFQSVPGPTRRAGSA